MRVWDRLEHFKGQSTQLFDFRMMNRMDSCTINHFQLRSLLSCPSTRGVYFPHLNRVKCWNPTTGKSDVVVELHEAILPRISTLLATLEYTIVGGLGGELMAVPAGKTKANAFCMVSQDTDNIVTNIAKIPNEQGCLVASNDAILRRFSIEGLRLQQMFRMEWSINSSAVSPDTKRICVVGDSSSAAILDMATGKECSRLTGHLDYSFDCSWSSDGKWLVTGNQDHTTRIYDTRNLNRPFKILRGEMAAIRSLEFSADSQCLAVMEADDFVHLYDVTSSFEARQTIDYFGETAGIGFSPDAEYFFIGIAGIERGGIFEYKRNHAEPFSSYQSILL